MMSVSRSSLPTIEKGASGSVTFIRFTSPVKIIFVITAWLPSCLVLQYAPTDLSLDHVLLDDSPSSNGGALACPTSDCWSPRPARRLGHEDTKEGQGGKTLEGALIAAGPVVQRARNQRTGRLGEHLRRKCDTSDRGEMGPA